MAVRLGRRLALVDPRREQRVSEREHDRADVRRDLGITKTVEYHPVAASELDDSLFGRRASTKRRAA